YELEESINAKNVSSQDIVLLITEVDITGPPSISQHQTFQSDSFFSENDLGPNASEPLSARPMRYGPSRKHKTDRTPNAKGKAVFIQFADGSDWGDPMAAAVISRQRFQTYNKIKSLLETYKGRGERPFLAELMQPSDLQLIQELQGMCQSDPS